MARAVEYGRVELRWFLPVLLMVLLIACHRDPGPQNSGVTLPEPTGVRAVGRTSQQWGDSMVHVWYPMAPDAKGAPAPYVEKVELLRSKIQESYFEILRVTEAHSLLEKTASLDPSEKHPIVIFSHGHQMSGLLYTAITEDLASHGYVVVSIDHPQEALFTIYPAGKVVTYSAPQPGGENSPDAVEAGFRRMIDQRVTTLSFAIAQTAMRFAGQLDLSRLAVVGHSNGGIAASRICEIDTRVAACANLDGRERGAPFYLAQDGQGPAKPFLYFAKPLRPDDGEDSRPPLTTLDQYNRDLAAVTARDKQRMESLKTDSYTMILAGASHDTFSDVPLLLPSTEEENAANRKRIQIVREYLRAFLDRYLRTEPATLLDRPTPFYPEIAVTDHSSSRLRK